MPKFSFGAWFSPSTEPKLHTFLCSFASAGSCYPPSSTPYLELFSSATFLLHLLYPLISPCLLWAACSVSLDPATQVLIVHQTASPYPFRFLNPMHVTLSILLTSLSLLETPSNIGYPTILIPYSLSLLLSPILILLLVEFPFMTSVHTSLPPPCPPGNSL